MEQITSEAVLGVPGTTAERVQHVYRLAMQ